MIHAVSTDGQLWDYCQRLFGVGDWDELTADVPFWKYRQKEVIKVAAKRKKLKAAPQDLAVAADYCKANGIHIANVAWLYKHLPASRSWMSARERTLSERDLDELLLQAIEVEAQESASPWLDRLMRAHGEHRREVYEEWKASRLPQ